MYEKFKTNSELLTILENILENLHEGICITDGEGIILRIGKSCESLYGITDEYKGRHVSALEEEGIFSPSLTLVAIKERKRVAMMQPDRFGHELLVTAMPIFDPDTGKIVFVISYASWDFVNVTELQAQYQKLQKEIALRNVELEAYQKKLLSSDIIVKSLKMQSVQQFALRFAALDVDILLTGETGTGKSNLARYIHITSGRREQPFCHLSCADFSPDILEKELFGYISVNPSTGEEIEKIGLCEIADSGTLLLEDIENLSSETQGTLLHLLKNKRYFKRNSKEPKKVDIRLIATSRKSLDYLSQHLREGFFYQLSVAQKSMPSLKERKEDIPDFIRLYLDRFNKKFRKNIRITPSAVELLQLYHWPGNIEELKHVIQKLVLTMEDEVVQPYHLPDNISPFAAAGFAAGIDLKEYLEYYEGRLVLQAYEKCGSTVALARYLGISQATAVRKLQKYARGKPLFKNE